RFLILFFFRRRVMYRWLLACATVAVVYCPRVAGADAFDHYINTVLTKVPESAGVKEIKQLTPALIAEHSRVLPGTTAAFIVVKTNGDRFGKLLVQAARQKLSDTASLPILFIERFVTYKDGEERAIQADGQNVRLFNDFLFNLDLGQVVPAAVGGDLRFVTAQGKSYAEPVGKAKLYLITKPLPE